jgi:hypothetical protein
MTQDKEINHQPATPVQAIPLLLAPATPIQALLLTTLTITFPAIDGHGFPALQAVLFFQEMCLDI